MLTLSATLIGCSVLHENNKNVTDWSVQKSCLFDISNLQSAFITTPRSP